MLIGTHQKQQCLYKGDGQLDDSEVTFLAILMGSFYLQNKIIIVGGFFCLRRFSTRFDNTTMSLNKAQYLFTRWSHQRTNLIIYFNPGNIARLRARTAPVEFYLLATHRTWHWSGRRSINRGKIKITPTTTQKIKIEFLKISIQSCTNVLGSWLNWTKKKS